MDIISVNVQIGEKTYPMKVKASDELKVHRVASIISEQLAKYKSAYGAVDRQDILSMIAFDAVFEKLQTQEKEQKELDAVSMELDNLISQLAG
ncbi:MAG TPA: cell division protein ZapA [Catalimonadaceae bacterium]|nr:cell division protein ZapA [Catalimonadaceae bacterium]